MVTGKNSRFCRPENIVHFCFFIVFAFSTLLTWREALVLQSTYQATQRAWLRQTASGLEHQLQKSIDEMYFIRNMLRHALSKPMKTDKFQDEVNNFNDKRHDSTWEINANSQRGLPINGISDEMLRRFPLLSRADQQRLENELNAALEMSYILQFNNPSRDFHYRSWYLSRAGFYLSTAVDDNPDTVKSFNAVVERPYFTSASPEENPERGARWTGAYQSLYDEGEVVTLTLPVDYDDYWYGLMIMDFSTQSIKQYLQKVLPAWQEGRVVLFDRMQKPVVASDGKPMSEQDIDQALISELFEKASHARSGHIRDGVNSITWVRLKHFDGLIVNVQTLREGMQGEAGRITIVLILMWGIFSLVLLASHQAIIRLVKRLLTLQETLTWRANYDGLTRQLNRSAFFEQSEKIATFSELHQLPLSLIQLDLDHFKSVNDTQGHHAGDLVLAHAAAVIANSLRKSDVLGRVGGEEFCIVLPNTGLEEAETIAERIRVKLASEEVLTDARHTLNVTASLGVSSSEEKQDYLIEHLQSVADVRLYQAKQSGRNCVVSKT